MTDNEIIKVLECCGNDECSQCPLQDGVCSEKDVIKDALSLINRKKEEIEALIAGQETLQKYIAEQKAEIERLKKERADVRRDLQIVLDNSISAKLPHCVLCGNGAILTESIEGYDKLIADISAEAIKEFAERLKKYEGRRGVPIATIDNLVKEMVGEGG